MAAVLTPLKTGSALTPTVNVSSWDAGASVGDVLFLAILVNGTLSAGPAGWNTGTGSGTTTAWFWKISDGTETTLSYTFSPTDRGSLYYLAKISGLNSTTPLDAGNVQSAGGGASYATPTVSTSAGNKLAIGVIGDAKDTGGAAATLGSWTNSFTEVADMWAQTTNPASTYVLSMGVATRALTGGAGISTGATFSSSTGSLARVGIMAVFNVADEEAPEDEEAPSVPAGLTATATAHNYITVGWTASTDNVGVTGYDMRVDGGTPFAVTGTSRTVGSLFPSTEYTFEVRAKDAAGNLSAWSTPLVQSTTAVPDGGTWVPFSVDVLDDGHNDFNQLTTLSGWTCDADDLLVLVAMTDDALLASPEPQPEDDGWTRLWFYEDSGTGATHVIWYKVADGTEDEVSFSVRYFPDPPANIEHAGTVYQLLRVKGVNPENPIDVHNAALDLGTAPSGAIAYSTPTISTSSGRKLVLATLLDFKQTDEAPSTISGWSAGFTEISDVHGKPAEVSVYMMNQAVAWREVEGPSTLAASANFLASPLRLGASGVIVSLNGLTEGAPGSSLPYPAAIVGRHFVDQFGQPCLYRMDVSWRLQLRDTGTVWADYFANRRAKGFNVVEVSIGPSLEGIPPNTDSGVAYGGPGLFDVSTEWLQSLRTMADVARTYGITLAVAVGYDWGFSAPERAAYVGKIADEFADCPNVNWVFGVDWAQPFWSGQSAEVVLVKDDMRAAGLNQPMTVLLDKHYTTSDNAALVDEFDYESVYGYEAQYDLVAHAHSIGTKPVVLGESNFEGENNEQGPATTAETLRRQALWTMTRGGVGWDYGHAYIWRQSAGWESFLNTPVHAQLTAIQGAFEDIDWWKLVPDTGNAFLTAGAGSKPASGTQVEAYVDPLESAYATAAVAADGSLGVVYVPTGRSFTVNLGLLGSDRSLYRVDPTNGSVTSMTVSSSFSSPGNNAAGQSDWLYVFQADPIVTAGPRVAIDGIEQQATWTLAVNGVEQPVTWSRSVDGVEAPLA